MNILESNQTPQFHNSSVEFGQIKLMNSGFDKSRTSLKKNANHAFRIGVHSTSKGSRAIRIDKPIARGGGSTIKAVMSRTFVNTSGKGGGLRMM